jgi:hypothetical protein
MTAIIPLFLLGQPCPTPRTKAEADSSRFLRSRRSTCISSVSVDSRRALFGRCLKLGHEHSKHGSPFALARFETFGNLNLRLAE